MPRTSHSHTVSFIIISNSFRLAPFLMTKPTQEIQTTQESSYYLCPGYSTSNTAFNLHSSLLTPLPDNWCPGKIYFHYMKLTPSKAHFHTTTPKYAKHIKISGLKFFIPLPTYDHIFLTASNISHYSCNIQDLQTKHRKPKAGSTLP